MKKKMSDKNEELYLAGFISEEEFRLRRTALNDISNINSEANINSEEKSELKIIHFKEFDNNIREISSTEFPTIDESLLIYKDLESQENFLDLNPSIEKNQISLDLNEIKNQGASHSILEVLQRYPKLKLPGSTINCTILIDKNWEKEKFIGKKVDFHFFFFF